jgi:hypothetical protein
MSARNKRMERERERCRRKQPLLNIKEGKQMEKKRKQIDQKIIDNL